MFVRKTVGFRRCHKPKKKRKETLYRNERWLKYVTSTTRFQSYCDLKVVARIRFEPKTACSPRQSLNHCTTIVPKLQLEGLWQPYWYVESHRRCHPPTPPLSQNLYGLIMYAILIHSLIHSQTFLSPLRDF